MSRPVAIVITGVLRCLDETMGRLLALAEDCDLFVVTGRDFADEARRLKQARPEPTRIRFSDEAGPYKVLEDAAGRLQNGRAIRQWIKLALGFEALAQEEARRGEPYACAYKIRTDIEFDSDGALDWRAHADSPRTLFMRSDIYFGGARPAFERACRFLDVLFERYYDNAAPLQPEDWTALARSRPGAGPFLRLAYPGSIGAPTSAAALLAVVREQAGELSAQAGPAPASGAPAGRGAARQGQKFNSEPAFLHYINSCGLAASDQLGVTGRLITTRLNAELVEAHARGETVIGAPKLKHILQRHRAEGRLQEAITLLEGVVSEGEHAFDPDLAEQLMELYELAGRSREARALRKRLDARRP